MESGEPAGPVRERAQSETRSASRTCPRRPHNRLRLILAWRAWSVSSGEPREPSRIGTSAGASPSRLEPAALTLFDGFWAEFSPNCRYIAYQSLKGAGAEI